jgi:tRNA dimethylallyltransferase
MENKLPKLIAIVGPTASGKTSLGIEIAQKYNGEIIEERLDFDYSKIEEEYDVN